MQPHRTLSQAQMTERRCIAVSYVLKPQVSRSCSTCPTSGGLSRGMRTWLLLETANVLMGARQMLQQV